MVVDQLLGTSFSQSPAGALPVGSCWGKDLPHLPGQPSLPTEPWEENPDVLPPQQQSLGFFSPFVPFTVMLKIKINQGGWKCGVDKIRLGDTWGGAELWDELMISEGTAQDRR